MRRFKPKIVVFTEIILTQYVLVRIVHNMSGRFGNSGPLFLSHATGKIVT